MVARVCAILVVLSWLKIPWVVEQPQSSILEYSKPFQHLAKHFKVFKARGFCVANRALLAWVKLLDRSSCGLEATAVAVQCLESLQAVASGMGWELYLLSLQAQSQRSCTPTMPLSDISSSPCRLESTGTRTCLEGPCVLLATASCLPAVQLAGRKTKWGRSQ